MTWQNNRDYAQCIGSGLLELVGNTLELPLDLEIITEVNKHKYPIFSQRNNFTEILFCINVDLHRSVLIAFALLIAKPRFAVFHSRDEAFFINEWNKNNCLPVLLFAVLVRLFITNTQQLMIQQLKAIFEKWLPRSWSDRIHKWGCYWTTWAYGEQSEAKLCWQLEGRQVTARRVGKVCQDQNPNWQTKRIGEYPKRKVRNGADKTKTTNRRHCSNSSRSTEWLAHTPLLDCAAPR